MISIPSPMSLPPNVAGETRGLLTLQVKQLNLTENKEIASNSLLFVKIAWWGDQRGLGTVRLGPNNVSFVNLSISDLKKSRITAARWPVQCSRHRLARYFVEMRQLHLDIVTDPLDKVIGRVWIEGKDLLDVLKGKMLQGGFPIYQVLDNCLQSQRMGILYLEMTYQQVKHREGDVLYEQVIEERQEDVMAEPIEQKKEVEVVVDKVEETEEIQTEVSPTPAPLSRPQTSQSIHLDPEWQTSAKQLLKDIDEKLTKLSSSTSLPEPNLLQLSSKQESIQPLESNLSFHLYRLPQESNWTSLEPLKSLKLPTTLYLLARVYKIINGDEALEGVLSMELLGANTHTDTIPLNPNVSIELNLEHTLPLAITKGFIQRHLYSQEDSPLSVRFGNKSCQLPWRNLLAAALSKKLEHKQDQAVCSSGKFSLDKLDLEVEVWIGEWNALSAVRKSRPGSFVAKQSISKEEIGVDVFVEQVLGNRECVNSFVAIGWQNVDEAMEWYKTPIAYNQSHPCWNSQCHVGQTKGQGANLIVEWRSVKDGQESILGKCMIVVDEYPRMEKFYSLEMDGIEVGQVLLRIETKDIIECRVEFKHGSLSQALNELESKIM